MRKARIRAINSLIEEIKTKGHLTHNEATRFIMTSEMVSRMTAERYIEDLMFIGKIIEKQDKITLAPSK
jgi:hypothetical protein